MEHLLERFEVTVLPNAQVCDAWIEHHVYGGVEAGQTRHVGFDTEAKPQTGSGDGCCVALIQLAVGRAVLLYRVHDDKLSSEWPRAMVRLLQDDAAQKYCVDTRGDLRLLQLAGVQEPRGFVDVQEMAITTAVATHRMSIKRLAHLLLGGLEMEKSKSMSTSDWSRSPLTIKQIVYAACDAIVSLGIADALGLAPASGLAELGRWEPTTTSIIDYSKPKDKLISAALTSLVFLQKGPHQQARLLDDLMCQPAIRRLFASRDEVLACADQHSRLLAHTDEQGVWWIDTVTPTPAWLRRSRQPFSVAFIMDRKFVGMPCIKN